MLWNAICVQALLPLEQAHGLLKSQKSRIDDPFGSLTQYIPDGEAPLISFISLHEKTGFSLHFPNEHDFTKLRDISGAMSIILL